LSIIAFSLDQLLGLLLDCLKFLTSLLSCLLILLGLVQELSHSLLTVNFKHGLLLLSILVPNQSASSLPDLGRVRVHLWSLHDAVISSLIDEFQRKILSWCVRVTVVNSCLGLDWKWSWNNFRS